MKAEDITGGILPAKKTELTWSEKFFIKMSVGFIVLFAMAMMPRVKEDSSKRRKLKEKLRYFNPTIHEGVFFDTITWTGRDKPLTDEELEKLL